MFPHGMAVIPKRLLTLCLALAFLLGVTAQLVPPSMAGTESGVCTDMAGGRDGSRNPRPSHLPNCIDHLGCLTLTALPASPTALAVAFEWTSLDYDFTAHSLAGISLKPELSPPILTA